MADRYNGKYIDREYVNGQWVGIKAGPMPIAYTGSINDPDRMRNTSLVISASSDGAPSVSDTSTFAVTTVRYGSSAYIQQAIELKTLNTYVRYYDGTSWGPWVAGNDNTAIDSQIATINSQINSINSSLNTIGSTASNALNTANTANNKAQSAVNVNGSQNTSISQLQTKTSGHDADILKLYSNTAASRYYSKGNIDGTHINNYNEGIISVSQKGFTKKLFRQNSNDQSVPIVADNIASNQYCKLFDVTYNCRSYAASGDRAFAWSTTAPLHTVISTAEGKAPVKVRFCSWPIVTRFRANMTAWAITEIDEHSNLTAQIIDTGTEANWIKIGRLYGGNATFAAFTQETIQDGGGCLILTGTVCALFNN